MFKSQFCIWVLVAAVKCKTCDIKGIALFVWFKNRIFTYASVTVMGFSVRLKEFELFMYKWHSVLITAYKFPLVHAINLFSRETIDKVCYVNSIKINAIRRAGTLWQKLIFEYHNEQELERLQPSLSGPTKF